MTKPQTRIVKAGTGHSYRLDGRKVPGVTTVIGNGIPKPALVGWAARTVAEYVLDRCHEDDDGHLIADRLLTDLRSFNDTRRYPERLGTGFSRIGYAKLLGQVHYADRDEAANRGTEVHALAERLAHGEEVDVPDELAGHVDAYVRFLNEWDPTDAITEFVVANRRWGYMGKGDMICTLPVVELRDGTTWGGRTLLDIKTSRSGPFGEVALQLAGYRYAETIVDDDGTERPMEPVDSVGVVWVRADGYDVIPFRASQQEHRIFLYAKQVGEWLDAAKDAGSGIKGDALEAPEREETAA